MDAVKEKRYYGWYMVMVSAIIYALVYSTTSTGSVFTISITQEQGFSRSLWSSKSIFTCIGSLISCYMSGRLIQRFGLKRIMLISTAGVASTFFIPLMFTDIRQYYVLSVYSSATWCAATIMSVPILINRWFGPKKKGIAIIYITHRLTEVFEIATHVAIMRDGVITLEGPVKNFTKEMLIQGLLPNDAQGGQQTEKAYVPVDYAHLKPVMQVKDFSGYGFSNITFDLYPGEILGIAGVVGAGRTELISTIFGRDKVLGGKVILAGKDITGLSTKQILQAGINFVPEDRHYHGIFKIRSISSNTTSALLSGKDVGAVNMNRRRQSEISQKYVNDFRTKIVSLDDQIGSLSGGNQQKVVIARALSTQPKVVILDEPTRGIDAAARGDVYNIIRQLKDAGVAVLMVSSDMEEVVELADRAITVFQGRINGEFSREEITQDALTSASFGIAHERKV